MKIIALPDLHDGGTRYLEHIAGVLSEVDLILLVGDFTNMGNAADAARVLQDVERYNKCIRAVPGNWDTQEVSDYLTQHKINLHRHSEMINGVTFVGVGGSLPYGVETPTIYRETDFEAFLLEAMSNLDTDMPTVLISHQPPYGTCCDLLWDDYVGSKSIRAAIEKYQPLICFTGHLHDARGIGEIGKTKIINPGPLWKGGYAYAEMENGQVTLIEICTSDAIESRIHGGD
jgi:uncharacterized protein